MSRTPMLAALPWAQSTFVSLGRRDYRLLSGGLALAVVGWWSMIVAQGWLVVELTDSKFILGVVSACQSLPFLLISLPAGVLADRIDRRRLLTLTRGAVMAVSIALAALVLTDRITVWLLAAGMFVVGCGFALDLPARQSLIPDLVEPDELTNAMAVNQLTFTASTLIGPAIGGLLLATVGAGGAFLATAVGNAALILLITRMDFRERPRGRSGRSVRREIGQGLRYVVRDPVLQPLVALGAVVAVLGQPYQSLLPAVAKDTLGLGPGQLGLLYIGVGMGATVGVLSVAAVGNLRRKGAVLLTGLVAFGGAIAALSLSRDIAVALPTLAVIGLAGSLTVTLNNTVIALRAPADLRGRVMSVNVVVFGLSPAGSLLLGALADAYSVPVALAATGTAVLLIALLAAATRPSLRAL